MYIEYYFKMNIRKLHYNYLKPQNYYNRLLTFFFIISFFMTLSLSRFNVDNLLLFFIKYFIVLFFLLFVAVLIEYFYRGEYMNPIEVFEVETFFNIFKNNFKTNSFDFDIFFSRNDFRSKGVLSKLRDRKTRLILSSIRKHGELYEVTFFDEKKMLEYYVIRFLARKGIHKMYIKEVRGQLRIIKLV